jgi:CheY-like chemotaxis protein
MQGPGRRLLIVDDEPLVRRALARLLSGRYAVECAFSVEALEMLRGGARFDAILCDIRMPVLTGEGLHRALSGFAPEQAARMIFMTAGATGDWVDNFLRSIPNLRIYKPFDPDALEALLDQFFRAMQAPEKPVLLVDDDPGLRETTRYLLEEEGYRVRTAGDGEEAIQILASPPRPGLVLLDLVMPVMDGWQFLAEAQSRGLLAEVPVVVVSATRGAKPAGVEALLHKPARFDELLSTVARYAQ